MQNSYFQSIEKLPSESLLPINEVLDQLAFNDQGLIPVISQDFISKEVLMMAWMNRTAIDKTLDTGKMTYWSRSRNKFWVKGDTSGHFQDLISMSIDCDGDVILCQVKQTGAACHTGRKNCFYLSVDTNTNKITIIGDAQYNS
jgi:phosphoribosyl-AMP cyclohydrolase